MKWRKLSVRESSILSKMLEADFPGRDAIAEQISHALVREIDPEGSLEFNVRCDRRVETKHRVPVEGWVRDTDGVKVNLLLHVVEGRVTELEVYKDDISPLLKSPTARGLQVFIPG